jgi:hypothetical protein
MVAILLSPVVIRIVMTVVINPIHSNHTKKPSNRARLQQTKTFKQPYE